MADTGRHAVHRTMVLVDVEGFGARSRTLPHQLRTREGVYAAVAEALAAAGVPWDECYHEDRGDSVFVLVPPTYPKAPLVEVLPGALARAARGHNTTNHRAAEARLRLAVHAGEVAFDDHGVTSTALTTAFRLLDADPLKQALAGSPGVVAMIVSRLIFDDVVRHCTTVDPATFRPVEVRVKEVSDQAWVALPDSPYPPDPQGSGHQRTAAATPAPDPAEPPTIPIPTATWHHPVNVSAGSGTLTIRGADFAGGNIDKRRNVRIGTGGLGWLVFAAVVLLGGTTGVVVAASSGPPDPTTIGTERTEAGVRETTEAVLAAYADRDVEQLCGLMSNTSKNEFKEAILATWVFGKCDHGMERMLEEAAQEHPGNDKWVRSLVVEDVKITDSVDARTQTRSEDSAAKVRIVSTDPGLRSSCQNEFLKLQRENGRWTADLKSFSSMMSCP